MRTFLAVLAALLVAAVSARDARAAISACTAANISANDSGCPTGTGPCNITKKFAIGNGCTLDFGTRAVTVTGSGELDISWGSVALKAGTLTVAPSGVIVGKGTQSSPPGSIGGMIQIFTTGAVTLQKAGTAKGVIDVSGNAQAGTILIEAGGTVTLQGKLLAQQLASWGSGGNIQVHAGGDFIAAAQSNLAAGGGTLGYGGYIDIRAGGRVDLGDRVDLVGGEGGSLSVYAGADAVVRAIDTYANGDAGSGGDVDVTAETRVQALQAITANGNGSNIGSGGGNGGYVYFESRFGDLTISANVLGEGAAPDGSGGYIEASSRGAITAASAATLSVRGNGDEGSGGDVWMEAFLDISTGGLIDNSGGYDASWVELYAGRDVTVTGRIDASGRITGAGGGFVSLGAGDKGKGRVWVQNTIDAGGGICSVDLGCGSGGSIDLEGCDVTLTSAGSLLARAAQAGDILVIAREQLTLQGRLDVTTTTPGGQYAFDGTNIIRHPIPKPPSITGPVALAAAIYAHPVCTDWSFSTWCLVPCPTCGNGAVEFPETCDTLGTPQSCDGCSVYCQAENCNDASSCTSDSCDLRLGCRWVWASCSDGNPCTMDYCNYPNGPCIHYPVSNPPACP